MKRIALGTVAVALGVALAGCGSKSQIRRLGWVAPPEDVDAASTDAGPDALVPPPDASAVDAGLDALVPRPDAALPDAAQTDAAVDAAVLRDAGRDAGTDAAVVTHELGCADGQREAFQDRARYPDIAGCSGGWTRPGVVHPAPVTCGGQGGDDGPFPDGGSCGVADFCEVGWHVCTGPADVAAHSPDGCAGSHDAADSFFVTRMSSSGCGVCATGTRTDCSAVDCDPSCAQTASTTNDVFGCGTLGAAPSPVSCGVLDRFGHDLCGALGAPWSCSDDGSGTHEAELLVKPGRSRGGVVCCRD